MPLVWGSENVKNTDDGFWDASTLSGQYPSGKPTFACHSFALLDDRSERSEGMTLGSSPHEAQPIEQAKRSNNLNDLDASPEQILRFAQNDIG